MRVTCAQLNAVGLLAAALVIVAMPLWLASAGLRAYFTGDDMMNLYTNWSKPWRDLIIANIQYYSPFYRPLGGLFYRVLFAVFGFNPLPFRIACFAIMGINLWLLYATARELGGARETGVLTALLGSYHAHFVDLYYNTGTVYDLLCFFFYVAAFLVYIRARNAARPLLGITPLIALLFVSALNAKEMAVTLPLTVMLYEFIYHRPTLKLPDILRWSWRNLRVTGLLAALAIPFTYGKLSTASVFAHVGAYQLHISPKTYLTAYGRYLDWMLYQQSGWFTNTSVLLLWTAMLFAAALSRRKELWFSWAFVLLSVLPVIFIPTRGSIFVLYIPFIGWTLYAAALLIWMRDSLARLAGKVSPSLLATNKNTHILLSAATFTATAICLASVHNTHTGPVRIDPILKASVEQIHKILPTLPANGRVLLVDDPFSTDEWTPLFLVRLSYCDDTIQVDRVKMMSRRPEPRDLKTYNAVLTYRNDKFVRIDPRS